MMILSFFAVAFMAHRRKRNGDALAPCGFSPWIANRKPPPKRGGSCFALHPIGGIEVR
jgi:hypothetical protein